MQWKIDCTELKEEIKKHQLVTGANIINFDFKKDALYLYSYNGPTSIFSKLANIKTAEPVQFSAEMEFMVKLVNKFSDTVSLKFEEGGTLKYISNRSRGEIICTPWEGQENVLLENEQTLSSFMKDAIFDLTPKVNLDKKCYPENPGLQVQMKNGKLRVMTSGARITAMAVKAMEDLKDVDESADFLLSYCMNLSKIFDKSEEIEIRTNISTLQFSSEKRIVNLPLIKIINAVTIDNMLNWASTDGTNDKIKFSFDASCKEILSTMEDFDIYLGDATGAFCIKGEKGKPVVMEASSSKGKMQKKMEVVSDQDFTSYVIYTDLVSALKLSGEEINFRIFPNAVQIKNKDYIFTLNAYSEK